MQPDPRGGTSVPCSAHGSPACARLRPRRPQRTLRDPESNSAQIAEVLSAAGGSQTALGSAWSRAAAQCDRRHVFCIRARSITAAEQQSSGTTAQNHSSRAAGTMDHLLHALPRAYSVWHTCSLSCLFSCPSLQLQNWRNWPNPACSSRIVPHQRSWPITTVFVPCIRASVHPAPPIYPSIQSTHPHRPAITY